MKITLVCLEDGITSCGFRKMAAYVERLNPDTRICFVSTNSWRSLLNNVRGSFGTAGLLHSEFVNEIAQDLVDSDIIGFSSMTGYADLTKAIIRRVREISRRPYLIWGGIHPIIHPEDAIQAEVDAICTGEGEFAFHEFLEGFKSRRDFTRTKNFYFKHNGRIVRNGFRPLMTPEEMETLPYQKYGTGEWIYRQGRGFIPLGLADYLKENGLGYNTVWSIGCPFHCTFCGNTKFIANHPKYTRPRYPSPRYIVEEVLSARRTFPHISSVSFHDDSFMAISLKDLEAFSELWRAEVGIPFGVFGVIPNYVRREKHEVLTWAGMNRIRMGIQSGSRRILDFYKRATPEGKIEVAAEVNAFFARRYQIPPAYDIIMDNPIETRQDVLDTLNLLYRLERPYTVNLFSLRVIPNTNLEKQLKELGVDLEEISRGYVSIAPKWANILVHLLEVFRPPRWLFDFLLRRVEASRTPQASYPILARLTRILFLAKRGVTHLRFMEFSSIPGWIGYLFWRLGIISFWWRFLTPRPPNRPRRTPDR